MSPEPAGPNWCAVSASVRGGAHERGGTENQDAALVTIAGVPPGCVVAATADGHGSARYVRSATGARLAVEVACEVGASALGALDRATTSRERRNELAALAAPIVESWRSEVAAHVERHPFNDDERAVGGHDIDAEPFVAYGTTLMVAILAPHWLGLVQVGDGDALLVDSDGSVHSPLPPDERLVGGATTSLCLIDAHLDARIALVEAPMPRLVLLSTDGYGNSFASDQWRADAGSGFLDAVRSEGLDAVATQLSGWLHDSAQASGDDVTMVLAERATPAATH